MSLNPLFEKIRSGLIVSCQAYYGEPLFGFEIMSAMAICAQQGGAVGIRANGSTDIRAIKASVEIPVIGLYKIDLPGFSVRITPTLAAAVEIALAGADMVALDATARPHPENQTARSLIQQVRQKTQKVILADIATFDEGLAAEDCGADAVSTTLSGYTEDSPHQENPDFDLLERLIARLKIPVIAEGRIVTPQQAGCALKLGAFAVVVGTAITRPKWITEKFIQGLKRT